MQVGAAGNLGVSEPRAVWGKDAPAGQRLLYDEPTGPTVTSPVKLGRRDGEDAPRACLGIGFISQRADLAQGCRQAVCQGEFKTRESAICGAFTVIV